MSQKEINKYDIIKKAINKELSNGEAGKILSLTKPSCQTIKKESQTEGLI
ncbi:MAG: hypothetical protein ABH919_03735 [bacterium]